MRSSCLFYPLPESRMLVERCGETEEVRFSIEDIMFHLTNTQMLDLGMKIQSIINAIDRENRADPDLSDATGIRTKL